MLPQDDRSTFHLSHLPWGSLGGVMEPAALAKLYDINVRSLKVNLEGVSHEESVRPPSGGGNSLNWVLGHIVANRNGILDLVGAPPIWSEELAAAYERGSTSLDPGAAQPLDRIL